MGPKGSVASICLRICVFSSPLVGLKRNSSLLDIFSFSPGASTKRKVATIKAMGAHITTVYLRLVVQIGSLP